MVSQEGKRSCYWLVTVSKAYRFRTRAVWHFFLPISFCYWQPLTYIIFPKIIFRPFLLHIFQVVFFKSNSSKMRSKHFSAMPKKVIKIKTCAASSFSGYEGNIISWTTLFNLARASRDPTIFHTLYEYAAILCFLLEMHEPLSPSLPES